MRRAKEGYGGGVAPCCTRGRSGIRCCRFQLIVQMLLLAAAACKFAGADLMSRRQREETDSDREGECKGRSEDVASIWVGKSIQSSHRQLFLPRPGRFADGRWENRVARSMLARRRRCVQLDVS